MTFPAFAKQKVSQEERAEISLLVRGARAHLACAHLAIIAEMPIPIIEKHSEEGEKLATGFFEKDEFSPTTVAEQRVAIMFLLNKPIQFRLGNLWADVEDEVRKSLGQDLNEPRRLFETFSKDMVQAEFVERNCELLKVTP
ncbi:hypothetical protein [Lentibacter algarum]|uniref:hypothetical protein n=1 Tax=Lentibacter algarum TaxID=576131 RepID=UPI001C06B901|nr:hypothetical protein [Lentibacter algarum]